MFDDEETTLSEIYVSSSVLVSLLEENLTLFDSGFDHFSHEIS